MNRTSLLWAFGLLTVLALASWSAAQEPVASPKNAGPIEVQTRGPLHDAMAQPFGVAPAPGVLVPKEPPAPIPEDPPAQKPDLENAQWVPGYWAWDAQRQEFMWLSGVYRVPPQDRSFVPGYWANTSDGWRWVPGFWSNAKLQDNTYTPEPPATLDNGPALAAPDENSLYVPGTWAWQQDRFVWRPGYWAAAQTGRVWVPPHYLWTPNGYVYVDGYWDYPLENRGMMFAPVTFGQPLWNDPNWSYQPSYVVNPNSFLDSAFVNNGGFYFGNYYNPRDARAGFNPWYTGRGRYDPTLAYHGWQNQRTNPNWLAGVQQTYAGRSAGRLAGPPLTFGQQGALTGGNFVTPLNQVAGKQGRLVTTTSAQMAMQRTGIQQSRQLAVARQQFEAAGAGKSNRANQAGSLRLTAGSQASSGPQIINGDPSFRGATNSGGTSPKIVNEARSFTPTTSGSKIVNSGPVLQQRTIATPTPRIATPPAPRVVPPQIRRTSTAGPVAAARVSAPVRTFNSAPARGANAARPAAGRKR
jgi:hypothetical protein